MFKSQGANALPALDKAIAKETDARVKQALTEARAAVVLDSDDASEADKIAGDRRDPRAAATRMRWRCSAACRPMPRRR